MHLFENVHRRKMKVFECVARYCASVDNSTLVLSAVVFLI